MNPKIEKEIKRLIDDNIVSWPFIMYLRKCEREIRSRIVNKIIYGVLGAAFTSGIITFIFRKEIASLIDDVQNLTRDTLINFVNKLKKFSNKKKN